MKRIIIAGGGAAGFFAAIACAEKNADYQIIILEKSPKLLAKVKISGGGRCNVTHACFDVRQLVKNYPRGEKQLLGPFTRFNPANTVEWFENRGVQLKTEADGRMFPVTDSSQTIIDCLLSEARRLGVEIKTQTGLEGLHLNENGKWKITTQSASPLLGRGTGGEDLEADAVIIATGGTPRMWNILEKLEHKIVPPVPSLFTFNVRDERIKGLEGISVPAADVEIKNSKLSATGPLLITHWGLSGPAILRLSAWGARELAALNYQFEMVVNWTGNHKTGEVMDVIKQFKQNYPKKSVVANPLFNLPKRLWERLLAFSIRNPRSAIRNFADLSNKQIEQLALTITSSQFAVTGKSTFKEEFVTAGGIELNEVDFKTMQSKKFPGLYFAGEVLDIDAITGGFNFQAAWTTGWIAGNAV